MEERRDRGGRREGKGREETSKERRVGGREEEERVRKGMEEERKEGRKVPKRVSLNGV